MSSRFTFTVPYPPADLFTPASELEGLLIALVASENARLAAASPADGKRIARVLDATTAQKSGTGRTGGLAAANRRVFAPAPTTPQEDQA